MTTLKAFAVAISLTLISVAFHVSSDILIAGSF